MRGQVTSRLSGCDIACEAVSRQQQNITAHALCVDLLAPYQRGGFYFKKEGTTMDLVKSKNFIVVRDFMVRDLRLKGNELLIYAIIFDFSQTEEQKFSGSLRYLAGWTNSTKQSVLNSLKSLMQKGYIKKEERIINGVKYCSYCISKKSEESR